MSQLRAFILAAGLGNRLRPLTDKIPKPLIPVFHKPLMTFALDHLLSLGIEEIGMNTRHLWEEFYREFKAEPQTPDYGQGNYGENSLHLFKESSYLDTGGGLRNARSFLNQGPFLLHNGDILTTIPLEELLRQHRDSGAIATLLLREGGRSKDVCYDEKTNTVLDIRGGANNKNFPSFLYTGIAIIEPVLLDWIAPEGSASLIAALLDVMKAGHRIGGLVSRSGYWSDLGTPGAYLQAHLSIAEQRWNFPYPLRNYHTTTQWPEAIHPTAEIAPSAKLRGTVVAGPRARIGAGARLTNCIISPGACVAANADLSNAIILPSSTLQC